jgi:thymidylate synthase
VPTKVAAPARAGATTAKGEVMSLADEKFVTLCRSIIDEGTTTQGELVRPVWPDGTSAYTVKQFGVATRYDLRKEFPALTLRRTALKSAMDEILWIYQKKSNNISQLNSHIWDEWADETGSIGKAYGYQVGRVSHYPEGDFDQMDKVLYDLAHTPYSRRIMTNLYNFDDLHEMHLYPCAYGCIYNVTHREGDDKPTLNLMLTQRSQDVLAANNWNVCQYALLLMMVAQVSNMYAGELLHVIADAHIYDRHIPLIEELIARPQYPAPTVRLNPEVKDFYAFTTDDLMVEHYQHGEQIKNIEIAI